MNFFQILIRIAVARPLAAVPPLYWYLTGRRVRARNRARAAAAQLPFAYEFWIRNVERQHELTKDLTARQGKSSVQPHFTILLEITGDIKAEEIQQTIRSLRNQPYRRWEAILVSPRAMHQTADEVLPFARTSENLESALAEASGDFVIPLNAGDSISVNGLLQFSLAVQTNSEAVVLFSDQDEVDSRGKRRKPWFKPKWNEELFMALDYLGGAVAIRALEARQHVKALERGTSAIYELLLKVCRGLTSEVVHLPYVLVHRRPSSPQPDPATQAAVTDRHVRSFGASAHLDRFGLIKVEWPLSSDPPLVTIIIPTRDHFQLLRTCIESLRRLTSYSNYELLVVDNETADQATLAYFEEFTENEKTRVIRFPGPFNFSAMNNFAVAAATGEYLCFLNNDTEIIDGKWLTEMMRLAVRQTSGAVGAKLLYGDHTIQHAGVIIGICETAGHAHRFTPDSDPGYFRQPHALQYISAVTGACMVIKKSKFLTVRGFDEKLFPVAYNDVDLCLKLQRAGWRNLYVPHAVLIHHESKSRGNDMSPEHFERYTKERQALQRRWGTDRYMDPLHNPNLDQRSETYIIGLEPRLNPSIASVQDEFRDFN